MKCRCLKEKCGYEWESRKEIPKQCPKCKRYDWDMISADKLLKEAN